MPRLSPIPEGGLEIPALIKIFGNNELKGMTEVFKFEEIEEKEEEGEIESLMNLVMKEIIFYFLDFALF